MNWAKERKPWASKAPAAPKEQPALVLCVSEWV